MISESGDGAGVLHAIEQEGNSVELYINDEYFRKAWDGMIPKAKKPEPKDDAVVIFDFSSMGEMAEELKKKGFPVLGGSVFADKLEQERMFGLQFAKKCGIKVPLTANFEGFDVKDVEDYIAENDEVERWVFKPSGEGLPCFLTYCSKDNEDLMRWVTYVEQGYKKKVKSFVLQEFKEGVCVSSEAWCDGTKFVRPFNHTVETKKFMDGELGQATGCSGNAVWLEHDESCRIISEGISLVEEEVVKSGHVGPIDLNAVANEDGLFALEWTPRFGFSAICSLIKLVRPGELGKMFSDIARGQGSELPLIDQFSVAAKLSVPPYPLEPVSKPGDSQGVCPNIGIPIRGIADEARESFYFYEVEVDEDGTLVHSEGTGTVADVIAVGEDIFEAFDQVYELLNEVVLPNKQYRTDLHECLNKMHEEVVLQEGKG